MLLPAACRRWTAWTAPPLARLLVAVALVLGGWGAGRAGYAQTDGLLQIGDDVHHFLERQRALGHLPADVFLSNQPLAAYAAQQYLDSLAVRDSLRRADGDEGGLLSPTDRRTLAMLRYEAPRPGAAWVPQWLGPVYRNGHDLFAVRGDSYALQVNPLFYGYTGPALQRVESDRATNPRRWRNTRGARVSGQIGPYIFFEGRLEETLRDPVWPRFLAAGNTAPRVGQIPFYQQLGYYDYWDATGIVGARTEHFEARFGRQRNRWGYGPGSVLLSNYSPVYDQLQLRTSFWRVQYTNLFARFIDATKPPTETFNEFRPRRYGAMHRLQVNVSDRVRLGVFEAVMFADDSTAARRRTGFEVGYLNPVIFYRAVDADLGSPDNVLVGLDAAWATGLGLELYGQIVFDEFTVDKIGTSSWANKWGGLVGAHWTSARLPVSVRAEVARIRPFVYTHRSDATAFIHYGDALGFPSGPNSVDAALLIDYRPPGRWQAALNVAYTLRGRGTPDRNVGADIARPYGTRPDNTAPFLQGVRQERWFVEGHLSAELLPRLYATASLQAELFRDAERGRDLFAAPTLGLRWGLPFESQRY